MKQRIHSRKFHKFKLALPALCVLILVTVVTRVISYWMLFQAKLGFRGMMDKKRKVALISLILFKFLSLRKIFCCP